jgi:hypothetical protein
VATNDKSNGRGLTLKDWALRLEPRLWAQWQEFDEAAALLGHYLQENPKEAIKLCLRSKRARCALIKRIETARRHSVATSGSSTTVQRLTRDQVLSATRGVWHDLQNNAIRMVLQIGAAVRAALLADEAIVTATYGAYRRKLDRIELEMASVDIVDGTLTIDAIVWRTVEVETANLSPATHSSDNSPPTSSNDKAKLELWYRGLPVDMIVTAGMVMKAFPALTVRRARALLKEVVPDKRRATRGTPPTLRRSK